MKTGQSLYVKVEPLSSNSSSSSKNSIQGLLTFFKKRPLFSIQNSTIGGGMDFDEQI